MTHPIVASLRQWSEWIREHGDKAFVVPEDRFHAYAELDAAADELERLQAIVERRWQPIETAPKDGTTLLVWNPTWYQGKGGQCVGVWFRPESKWYSIEITMSIQPTHWMPLPEPPTE